MNKLSKLFLAAGLLIFLAASCCNKEYQTFKNDPTNTRLYTLDNGLKVYLSVTKKEPRIQTYIAVRVGSKNDPHETTGLSHYLEHLMFKGTINYSTINYEAEKPLLDRIEQEFEHYRTLTDPKERKAEYALIDSLSYEASKYFIANEYDKQMAHMGAKGSNAFTSNDMTVYQEDIPSNQIEAWARLQSDRFKNLVIRGFHTELEAVYEECNMGLTNDSGNAFDSLAFAAFSKHPYGLQTTIGTQEHLKNPSITNIKKHFENFYVPNNVAICMAGDFDPDEAIKTIKKYFGDWKRNDNLKLLEFEDEDPITEPVIKTIYGREAPFMLMAWRFAGDHPYGREMNFNSDTLYMIQKLLNNGQAGLFDNNINRPGKLLGAYAFNYGLVDYNSLIFMANVKEGQSFDEAKELMLGQLDKIKQGDFDEDMLKAIVNNEKKDFMEMMEDYSNIASLQYESFINDRPWIYNFEEGERLSKITKEDIVKFASKYLSNNYVQINKAVGEPKGIKKLEKPAITPILTNRDTSSAFLRNITALADSAKPIEPVFVDFEKDMTKATIGDNQTLYYKHNDDNSLFNLNYKFNTGYYDNPKLNYAMAYLKKLSTKTMSVDERNAKLYALACDFNFSCGSTESSYYISGLGSSMEEAAKLAEDLIQNAEPNEELLKTLKANWINSLNDSKRSQSDNATHLRAYVTYGPKNPFTAMLKPADIERLTSEELLAAVKDLFAHNHDVLYYGALSKDEFVAKYPTLHPVRESLAELKEPQEFAFMSSKEPKVYVAPYKSNNITMNRVSVYEDEPYNPENDALIQLHDEYFGAGMSSIVFQDMREAKGLAYGVSAYTSFPWKKGIKPYFTTSIKTQNDKMLDAMHAFDEILTAMPEATKSFEVAKQGMLQNLATQRIYGYGVISAYLSLTKKGAPLNYYKIRYEKAKGLTLKDIAEYHKKYVSNLKYNTGILGNPAELNLKGIDKSYGPVKVLKTEDIFGY